MRWWRRFLAQVDDFRGVLFSELDGLVVLLLPSSSENKTPPERRLQFRLRNPVRLWVRIQITDDYCKLECYYNSNKCNPRRNRSICIQSSPDEAFSW
ncbi:unnamed protein product [Schistosoma mattheei]|uniref:Uncharacterized protein n=1 Tax=Schistosoma mattheei TaxID=31246 RepID=A0A183P1P7_9TREM|nr:unnamed protein product [Schistosoma mattheei]